VLQTGTAGHKARKGVIRNRQYGGDIVK